MVQGSDLLSLVRLRGVLRAASHTETLAAADIVNGMDTARRIKITPLTGSGAGAFVVVTRLQAQDIRPSNLTITARDLNRNAFRLPLTPDLVVDDVPLIGDATEGVELVVRNGAARAVALTIHVAVVTETQLRELLGEAADLMPWRGGR
jgi:hypothetical protein